LKASKCVFISQYIEFLGHVITPEGILPSEKGKESIQKYSEPRTIKQVQAFLGATGYYRKFIQNYSQIAEPLTNLIRKNTKFNWTIECQNAFDVLKEKLLEPPILIHFKENEPLTLYTDASSIGLGAILAQNQNGKEGVIGYASKKLLKHQSNYAVTELECLAVIFGVSKFRQYLLGNAFTIKVDHCALCHLMNLKDPTGKLARWRLLLSEYQFTIEYKSGKQHKNVDALSRAPVEGASDEYEDSPRIFFVEEINMKQYQDEDTWCQSIKAKLNADRPIYRNYHLINDILHRRIYFNDQIYELICLPEALRLSVLKACHDDKTSGHTGVLRTFSRLWKRYHFPKMERYVRKYVQKCVQCQKRKHDNIKKGLLEPVEVEGPFDHIGIDFMGPLPETPRRNTHLIVGIDYLTKWIIAKPVKRGDAATASDFIIEDVILIYGMVKSISTDRGKSFMNELFQLVTKEFGLTHIRTSGYHPRSNGLAERSIRTLTEMMSYYIKERHTDWDRIVPYVVFAYNTSLQATTRETPFFLLFGREARLPIDSRTGAHRENYEHSKWLDYLHTAWDLAKTRIIDEQENQEKKFNIRRRNVHYPNGTKVMLYTPKRAIGKYRKFLHRYTGPYLVEKHLSNLVVRIQNIKIPNQKPKIVNVDRLKLWHEPLIKEDITDIEEDVNEDESTVMQNEHED
jgi:hypothetical protein